MCSVGRPKHVRVMAGALEGDLFIGPKAEVTHTHTHCPHYTLYTHCPHYTLCSLHTLDTHNANSAHTLLILQHVHSTGCQNLVIICNVCVCLCNCRNTGVCYRFGTQWNMASLKTGMTWRGSGSTFTLKNSFRPSVRRYSSSVLMTFTI